VHRADIRPWCQVGLVCECGHCACDHFGRPCGASWCDALTAAGDVHECVCGEWRAKSEDTKAGLAFVH
jgi:hypothetical protein